MCRIDFNIIDWQHSSCSRLTMSTSSTPQTTTGPLFQLIMLYSDLLGFNSAITNGWHNKIAPYLRLEGNNDEWLGSFFPSFSFYPAILLIFGSANYYLHFKVVQLCAEWEMTMTRPLSPGTTNRVFFFWSLKWCLCISNDDKWPSLSTPYMMHQMWGGGVLSFYFYFTFMPCLPLCCKSPLWSWTWGIDFGYIMTGIVSRQCLLPFQEGDLFYM